MLTLAKLKKKLQALGTNEISAHCRKLINNTVDPEKGEYVLRAEQLSISYIHDLLKNLE